MANGTYTLFVDGIGDDVAPYQFTLFSDSVYPRIVSHAVTGTGDTVDTAWLHFDQPMDVGSFDLGDDLIVLEGTDGDVTPDGYYWHDADSLAITFAAQPAEEPLLIVLDSQILSARGESLDQDQDGLPGETPDDQYVATLLLDTISPYVFHTEPQSSASAPFDHVTLYFNEPIDSGSFSLEDVASFTGPDGESLLGEITGFIVGQDYVSIYFVAQTAAGPYAITVGPNIADAAGNLMAEAFTLSVDAKSADLRVGSIQVPAATTCGDVADFTWTVHK